MDSSILAKLTLMLLRASIQHPDSLSAGYGVVILPSRAALSQDEALRRLAETTGTLQVSADAQGDNLIVSIGDPTAYERNELDVTAETFVEGIRQQNKQADPRALVRAVGFGEEVVVPVGVAEQWLRLIHCSYCSMGIGLPGPKDHPDVVAVLYFGRRRLRAEK